MRISRFSFWLLSAGFIVAAIAAYLTHAFPWMLFALVALQILAVMRLHDIGVSGWWSALFTMVNLVLFFYLFANVFSEFHAGHVYIALALIGVAFFVQFLILYVRKGKRGLDRFGPDPRGTK